ncbi:17475_t:CDS:2, partial [Acaulospora morrowiae]
NVGRDRSLDDFIGSGRHSGWSSKRLNERAPHRHHFAQSALPMHVFPQQFNTARFILEFLKLYQVLKLESMINLKKAPLGHARSPSLVVCLHSTCSA